MKRILFLLLAVTILCLASAALAADPVPVESITLNVAELELQVQKNTGVRATIAPSNASNRNLAWSSSDETVATVSSYGVITGKKAGTCTVTCASSSTSMRSRPLQAAL